MWKGSPMARCNANSDTLGDHGFACALNEERIARHNHLRDTIYTVAAQAMLGPSKEPEGLLPGSDDRLADVYIPF